MISYLNKFRSLLLSPNSKFELWLRTWYHNINKTRLFFQIQHWLAKRSYQKWLINQEHQLSGNLQEYDQEYDCVPKLTFICSIKQSQDKDVLNTLNAIKNLQGNHWEVMIVLPRGESSLKLQKETKKDSRIKIHNQGTIDLLENICSDYVIFCQAGDLFSQYLLFRFYESLKENQPADLTYYDCEYLVEGSEETLPFFKPSLISPALLLSVNFLTRGFIRTDSIRKIWSDIDHDNDQIVQEYEVCLRLYESKGSFHHIPSLLLSQTTLSTPNNTKSQEILVNHLYRQGVKNVAAERKANGIRFTWQTGNPTIGIVILTRNNRPLLEPLVQSIFNHQDNPNCHIHIVDNGSDDEPTLAYYKTIHAEPNISIIPYDKTFNYSEAINLGVAESNSDLLLLMNDDMAVKDSDWLSELTQWAIRPEVGVVGAKLLRVNHTIQHAGIILGLTGFMGHIYLNASEHYNGLFGSVNWYRNYLAVTGACQMVRREVFAEVGGYDEGYQLAFGDIHFCTRVHEQGYQNIYTPFAKLFHFEGKSRGYITPVTDILKGYDDMAHYMVDEDPYFSSNLTYTRIPKCVFKTSPKEERLSQINARRKFYTIDQQ